MGITGKQQTRGQPANKQGQTRQTRGLGKQAGKQGVSQLDVYLSLRTEAMTRLPRIVIPNQPLHIMHRGNNRQDIFESEGDMVRIKEDIAVSLSKTECSLHAYVITEQRCERYREIFEKRNTKKQDQQITLATMRGEVYGSEGFHRKIGGLISRTTKLSAHGGDRKSEAYNQAG